MPNIEGFSNAVRDSMTAATPFVATNAGGAREFGTEVAAGYLVSVGTVVLLASRMLALRQAPAPRGSIDASARSVVEKTSTIKGITRRVELLYDILSGAIKK